MRAMHVLWLMLLLSGCAGGPGASCGLVKLADLPIEVRNNVPVLPVEINGRQASLVIDTGSDITVLTKAAARRLGIAEGTATQDVRGAGGPATVGVARLDSLGIGSIRLADVRIVLSDSPAPPLDGLLGIDVLIGYELDLDVPHRRATFYRARGCATALPDFPGRIIRLPTMQQAGSGHLFVSLSVDGQPLRGMLDSGASHSTLSLQSAEDAGLSRRRLAQLPSTRGQAVNKEGLAVRQTVFRQLQVGTDTMNRPQLTIADLPPFAGDLLVGSDYIGTRRVWFAFSRGAVFVSPESVVRP